MATIIKKTLTQSDIRELTRLTRAQLRYWVGILPPLHGKSGRKPCYSPAEALALRVLAAIVLELSCDVATLAPVSNVIFNAMCDGDWQRFEHRRLIIRPRDGAVDFPSNAALPIEWGPGLFIAIELAPHVQTVRSYSLGVSPEPVESRQLPLIDARKRRRSTPKKQETRSVP